MRSLVTKALLHRQLHFKKGPMIKFNPIKIGVSEITDQLLLRRVFEGVVNTMGAIVVQRRISAGDVKNADEIIEELGIECPVNNKKALAFIDKLYADKDQQLMDLISDNNREGIPNNMLKRILAETKGCTSLTGVVHYINKLAGKT